MVFNPAMGDGGLIDGLGGTAKVVELLGLRDQGALQRVSNWKRRGIPARVLLENPHVFRSGGAAPTASVPEQPQAKATACV
jgi:hypothetical protein